MRLQLALDHGDEGVAGHGVQFDALVEQDVDLRIRRAILGELRAQDARADLGRGGGLALKARDVVKPEPEIDHLDGAGKLIAPGIALQRAEDQEPGDVEVVQHEQRQVVIAADRRRSAAVAAVTDTPLVETIIRS